MCPIDGSGRNRAIQRWRDNTLTIAAVNTFLPEKFSPGASPVAVKHFETAEKSYQRINILNIEETIGRRLRWRRIK